MMTSKNMELPDKVVQKYLKALIGQFYKILPIKESGERKAASHRWENIWKVSKEK